MANLMHLRLAAREIFEAALRAVDPADAVRKAMQLEPLRLSIRDQNFAFPVEAGVFAVAIGKAAPAMAFALEDLLGARLVEGVIGAPSKTPGAGKLGDCWQCFEGGHPVPNEASLAAAEAAFALLDRANHERAFVIFMISGGGSAMLEAPSSKEITLEDLRLANQTLVSCGAPINEINAVRRAFSAVKGGKLAARAPNCQQVTLIVSDVPKDKEHDVASGPTLTPPADAPAAAEVIARYGLRDQLPLSIIRAVESAATAASRTPNDHPHFVVLDTDTPLEAAAGAALQRGFKAEIAYEISDEPIQAGVEKLLKRLAGLQSSAGMTTCLLSGGEFECPVRGDGIGGRNLDTALRLAMATDQNPGRVGEFVALCAGTDGIDGNSPAAGAIVDSTTIERARRIGLDPADFLNRSDSYSFFVALGDVITTGPTGTNVRDLRILISRGSGSGQ